MVDIPSRYNPKECEEKWYQFWEENGLFHTEVNSRKKPYCIVIPPPNITGILHMGHALNNTIQDILIRFRRMQGYCALWMPGTDHAGIATQNVVEKELAQEGARRQDLGREEFLNRVWQWKQKYGSTIITQLKKLGCSCDWQRTRFTMDEQYSDAVREVFIELAKEGLIYKANYIINWCPRCQTALSDEESQHKEVKGNLYYIKYPLKEPSSLPAPEGRSNLKRRDCFAADAPGNDGKQETVDYITVATTRPETMLGDTAVAVNPKDKRYNKLIGKTVVLPLVNKDIPVIADSAVDPKFGTGIVKVTPAHDPNDFEIAQRHNLAACVVMNADATMNENAPLDYRQMDRFEAREAILEDLEQRGLLEKTAPHQHCVGHCYRCHTMVEPYLSEQWFVALPKLGEAAEGKVVKGKVRFHPPRWKKVYLNWMKNLRGWCISRQIWWGHRIPAWYCLDCKKAYDSLRTDKVLPSEKLNLAEAGIMVSRENPKFCSKCGGTNIRQDEDVLDTWFSSWLWPFATFGWPALGKKEEKELTFFYPTSVLVTAQEIIFFWVARMIMAGMYFMKEVPFGDVYIHGTVRDITGTKMSKSLGNIIDPQEIISKYGCDALRFSIISLVATGQDVFLSQEKFESGRNFANKIWNAARFIMLNIKSFRLQASSFKPENLSLADRWILSRLHQTIDTVTKSLENFRFNDAARAAYEFFWHQFCDWYIELAKKTIAAEQTQAVLYEVLEKSLRMLHPLMPFITEELWQSLPAPRNGRQAGLPHDAEKSIMLSSWPQQQKQFIDKKAQNQMQAIISCITAIRNIRSVWEIEPAKRLRVSISVGKQPLGKLLKDHALYIKDLSRVESLEIGQNLKRPKASAVAVVGNLEIFVALEGVIDVQKEAARLQGKLKNLQSFLQNTEKKLKNKQFLKKAPKTIVAKEKAKANQLKDSIKKLKDNLRGFK